MTHKRQSAKKSLQSIVATNRRNHFERTAGRCYNSRVPHGLSASAVLLRGIPPSESAQCTAKTAVRRIVDCAVRTEMCTGSGQVAQVVERSPEKAGVGGSTPSLATTFQSTYSESLDLR